MHLQITSVKYGPPKHSITYFYAFIPVIILMRAKKIKNKILRASGAQDNTVSNFMTIPEVQSFLGIKSRKTILKYITSGKLCAYKVGGTRWRIASSDVMAFLKNQFTAIANEKINDGRQVSA